MDFKLVLSKLLTDFEKANVRYALMGGLALGAWGVPRSTVDIDFLVNREDMEKVDAIMRGHGYECRHKTENVSQYLSPLRIFGEVDFLHAFRTPSLSMLERAEVKKMFDETVSIKVLKVEDLIGFKLQAAVNDESRKAMDITDIESLISHNKDRLDWSLIEEYFTLFGLIEVYKDIKKKYSHD